MSKENKTMQLKNYNIYFFFGLLILVSVATFYIFKPFFVALLLAVMLAVLFQKPYEFFLSKTRNNKRLSSLTVSLIVLLLIIIPATVISVLVGNEIISSYQSIASSGDSYLNQINPLLVKMQASSFFEVFGLQPVLGKEAFAQYSGQIGKIILAFLQSAYLSAAHIIFMIFVMFFSLYYFFIDGKDIVKKMMYISPLRNSHENLLIEKFISISRATIKGNLVVAIIQGTIGAALFAAVGIDSAIIWGVAMMFLSLLPMMGTSLVWFPAGIIMLMMGNIWQGITILVLGFTIISTIDNVLSPELIGKDTQLHPLLLFFAILGGLPLFGFAGFIVGPVIVALFVSLWEIYGVEFKSQLKKYNS
jgi:predicted PurR-regulated permease PerM